MSSAVRKSKSAELEIYVWLVEQCDYDDGWDDSGRTDVVDVFAHLEAANKAAEARFKSECPDEEPDPDEEEDEAEEDINETTTRPNATSSTAPTALGEPQAKKRKQADQQV
ncbi:hypothetical protein LTR17_011531 [Elasticomyces elasticus]|nr:hypothetical protein LTR17_011531 [Elasticomyces elasticus]